MMSAEIRYFTKSKKGNTFKLAKAVGEALDITPLTVENDLKRLKDFAKEVVNG